MLLDLFLKASRKIQSALTRKKGVLFYLGMYKGAHFYEIFRKYKICYGFEANPELFCELKEKYKNFPHVKVFNVAVTGNNGETQFHISNNGGESSSVGIFDENFPNDIEIEKTINVQSINLYDFIQNNNIKYINDYISDIQGMDLEVLKTLKPLIDQKKIYTITCEVTKDRYRNIYKDLPDNSESGFKALLEKNYLCIAKGWGLLEEGNYQEVPETWWEMDCKWRAR